MKKIWLLVLLMVIPGMVLGQYKSQTKMPAVSEVLAKPTSSLIFNFLDPSKFHMDHHFSMSYMTMGGQGMMVNTYMNAMTYRFSEPLWLNVNLGIMNSPYSSFKSTNPALQGGLQFFGGAELNYRPTENSLISIGVNMLPPYYGYYGSPYYYSPGAWK
ncbi:MAG: hypothetical protein Kow0037_06630 [Calditrichia bacterium]